MEEQGVEAVVGDLFDPNSMREAFRGMQSAYFGRSGKLPMVGISSYARM